MADTEWHVDGGNRRKTGQAQVSEVEATQSAQPTQTGGARRHKSTACAAAGQTQTRRTC